MFKNLVFFVFLFLTVISLKAQSQLIFINTSINKIIKVQNGDQLSLQYKGYLGQTEYFKHNVGHITDSSVILGYYFPEYGAFQNKMTNNAKWVQKEILLKDITMFRRIGPGRQLLKSTLEFGTALSALFLLNNLYINNTFSNLQKFGITLSAGLIPRIIIGVIMPEKPKYVISDGWRVESVK